MLKNYLKIALRNLRKQKLYSVINILGLAMGLTFCVLVLLFIHDELTYDHFHTNSDRIYRLYRQPVDPNSDIDQELFMPIPVGPAMKADFPEVEEYVRLTPFGTNVIRQNGQLFEQDQVVFTDPQIFDLFTFPMVAGNPSTALIDPYSAVITKETAQKYFNQTNAVGKTLSIRLNEQFYEFTVSGVTESVPSNSTIQYSILLPHQTLVNLFDAYNRVQNRWDATRVITYVMLENGADVNRVRDRLPAFMETHMGELFNQLRQNERIATSGPPILYQYQPLTDVHLNTDIPGGFTQPSNPVYSYILGGIALAVLVIACINFMILAIARSAKRAKEVGMRKVAGAGRNKIMIQFWGEAFLLCLLAFALGIGLAEAVLPVFNELAGKTLSLSSIVDSAWMIPILVSIFIVTGFMAGSYPAMVLSGFKPIDSLKENISPKGSNYFTRSLIVTQFGLSVFLIISTLVMSEQLQYMQNKNLGFQGEQVVVIPAAGVEGERALQIYRDELGNETGVIDITGANVAFDQGLWRRGFMYEGELRQPAVFRVDHNYIETMKMELVAGRDFDPQLASDSTNSIIVNQAFVRKFGWTNQPVGKVLELEWKGSMRNPTVIGVVQDFHFKSLRNEVEPAMLYTNPMDPILTLMVRVRPQNMSATLDQLRATWNTITHEVPFSYRFLDDSMDRLYRSEERWSRIMGYGSFFAIFIACLGLFGLAGITTQRRRKEIGIRKVLGATVVNMIKILTKDFTLLVGVGILIAVPVAWYAMQQWLQNFAYRVDVGIGVFLMAGALALVVALLTVSHQALRAAMMNPVDSLRDE